MALSSAEQHKVIFYLGWPGKSLTSGSTDYNSVIYDRLQDLNATVETLVRGIIARIETLDTALEGAQKRLAAKEVDGIVLNEDEILGLKRERKRYCREISDVLDIPILKSGGVNMGVIN